MAEIKPFKTNDELIEQIKSRGLIINDTDKLKDFLERVNYYRLSAYFLTYVKDDQFYDGVSIDNIFDLYYFDYELRLILLKYIAEVEIYFRNAISYHLSQKYGSLCYIDTQYFKDEINHTDFLNSFEERKSTSSEPFVKHHKDKYNGVFPLWVAIQIITFGTLSKLYDNLLKEDQDAIARMRYGKKGDLITRWLKSVSDLRNLCAHWGRLYNRPMSPIKLSRKDYPEEFVDRDRAFAYMIALFNLLPTKNSRQNFRDDLKILFDNNHTVELKYLGCNGYWYEYMFI